MNLKKIIALALCVCMVLSFFPVSVFAEDWEDEVVLVDEEEYFEPQDEYVEEEIIEEEPADYAEYVEPAEELIVEEELIDEEPAAEEPAAEEPAAEEPAAEEPAAAVTAELETAETFGATAVARILTTDGTDDVKFASFATAYAAAGDPAYDQGGVTYALSTTIDLLGDVTVAEGFVISKGITVNGASHAIDGEFKVTGDNDVTVTVNTAELETATVSGGTLTINGGRVIGNFTVSGGEAVLNTEIDHEITVSDGKLTITGGNYSDVLAGNNPGIIGNVKGGTFGILSKVLLADGYVTPDYATSTGKYCMGKVTFADTEAMVGTAATGRSYGSLADLAGGTEAPKLLKDAKYALTESNPSLKVKLNNHVVDFDLPDGTYVEFDGPDADGVITCTLKTAVAIATVNGVANYYSTFDSAIDAAYYGGTVELLTDVEYDVWNQNLGKGWNVGPTGLTIDGKGHTWTVHGLNGGSHYNGNDLFHLATNLTVKNITVVQACDSTTAGAVTMMQGFGMNSGLLDHVTIIGGRFGAVPTGSITIQNCTFDGMGTAVYWENEAGREHVITGTTFKNTKATDVMGNMIFKGNTIDSTATVNLGYNFTGAVLSETAQNSFTGNTIAGELDIYQNCDVEGNDLSAATIATKFDGRVAPVTAADLSDNYFGDNLANLPEQVVITSVKSSAEAGAESTAVAAAVLNGEGKETFYTSFATAAEAAAGTMTIVLMADVDADYVLNSGETLKVKKGTHKLSVIFNGNPVLGITDTNGVTTYAEDTAAVARIGVGDDAKFYATLEEAIEKAGSGDIIVLVSDVDSFELPHVGAFQYISKNLTIDLNNCDLTVTGTNLTIDNGAEVTFKNGTIITNDLTSSEYIFAASGYSSSTSKLTFQDVVFEGNNITVPCGFFGAYNANYRSEVNLNNCEFNVTNIAGNLFYGQGYDENAVTNNVINVSGGQIRSSGENAGLAYAGTVNFNNVDVGFTSNGVADNPTGWGSVFFCNLSLNNTQIVLEPFNENRSETAWIGLNVCGANSDVSMTNSSIEIKSDKAYDGIRFSDDAVLTQDATSSIKVNNVVVAAGVASVGSVHYGTFAQAAKAAEGAVVVLNATPAAGDTYELTAGTLQVKLNGKVTGDAAIKALVYSNVGVPAIETDDEGVTTYTLVPAVAKVDNTLYTKFEDAVSAAGTTKFIELMANATYTMALGQVIQVKPGDFKFVAMTEGNKWLVDKEDLGEGVFKYTVSATEPEARIGDQAYATLAEAVAAVQGNEEITLLKDAVIETKICLPSNVTLNGDNHTISPKNSAHFAPYPEAYHDGYSMIEVESGVTGVRIQNVTVTSYNSTLQKEMGVRHLIAVSGEATIANVTLHQFTTGYQKDANPINFRGADAIQTNGICIVDGPLNIGVGEVVWSPISLNTNAATNDVIFTGNAVLTITEDNRTAPQAMIRTHGYANNKVEGTENIGYASVFGNVPGTYNELSGFESATSAKIGSADKAGTVYNYKVGNEYFATFKAAAAVAMASNDVVEVFKAPAADDVYALTTGSLKVKLNNKVANPLTIVVSASESWAITYATEGDLTVYSLSGPVVAKIDEVGYLKFADAADIAIKNNKVVTMIASNAPAADDNITLTAGQTLKVRKNNVNTDTHVLETGTTIITPATDEDGVTTYTCVEAVATITTGGEVKAKYPTLAAALAAAENGNTIELLKDVTCPDTQYRFDISKNITLDGKNHTITHRASGAANSSAILITEGTTATIKNVKVVTGATSGACISTNANTNLTLENVILDHAISNGRDALSLNGDCTIKGTFKTIIGETTWSAVAFNNTNETLALDSCDEFEVTDNRVNPSQPVIIAYTEGSKITGIEAFGMVPVTGTDIQTGFEPATSSKIGNATTEGSVYNFKAGNEYFTTFKAAAEDAKAQDTETIVELFATPADGDTYELTAGTTLKVKLNDKVADVKTIVEAADGHKLIVEGPVEGVTTCSLVAQNFNLAHMNNGAEVVDAYYDTFDEAFAAIGARQFINIYKSVNFEFAADTPVFYLKANGDAEFTYTVPNGYEILTKDGGAGSGSTRYECAAKTYNITYANIDGVSSSPTPTSYKTTAGGAISDVTREHYTFAGWDVSATTAGETVNFELDQSNNFATGCYGDVTLTANWTPDEYTVTFDPDNGGDTWTEKVTYPGKLTRPNDPTKTGYTIDTRDEGWYRGENPWRFGFIVQQNMTLKPKWNANAYTVTFDGNGSTSVEMPPQAFVYDEEAKALTKNTFTKTGYTFQGWARTADAQVAEFEDEQNVSNLTTEPNGVFPLYSVWEPNSYTINFAVNAPTDATVIVGEMTPISATYDVEYTLTNQFEIVGYDFSGWKTSSGSVISHTDPVKNLRTTPNGTITLNAQWTPTTYTLTLDPNNGKEAATSEYTIAGSAVLTTPEYPEHVFKGWKVTTANGNWTQDDVVPAGSYLKKYGNVTLTAQWTDSEAYNTDKGGYKEYFDTVDDALQAIENAKTQGDPRYGWYADDAVPTINASGIEYPLTAPDSTVKVNENGTDFKAVSRVGGKYAYRDAADGTWKLTDYVAKLYKFSYEVPPTTEHDGTVTYNYTAPVFADETSEGNGYETYEAAIAAYRDLEIADNEFKFIELIANTGDEKYPLQVDETVYYRDGTYIPTFADPDADHQQSVPVKFEGQGDHNNYVPENIYSVGTKEAATLTLKVAENSPEEARFYVQGATTGKDNGPWFYEGYDYTVKGEAGTAYTLPSGENVTAIGYKFAGWYGKDGKKVDLPETIEVTATYEATWVEDIHTITFLDGDTTLETIEAKTGDPITWIQNPTKTGYDFSKWLKSDGTEQASLTTMPDNDLILKADWSIHKANVGFWVNGVVAHRLENVEYNTQFNAPADPVVAGKQFNGWLDKDGNTVTFPYTMPDTTTAIHFYADFSDITYNVKFVMYDKTEITRTGKYGEDIEIPDTSSADVGYKFSMWTDKDGAALAAPTKFETAEPTYYGLWTLKTANVGFWKETLGSELISRLENVAYGTEINFPETPVIVGKTFAKWVDSEGNDLTFPVTMPDTEETVHFAATYTQNNYTLTFVDVDREGNVIATYSEKTDMHYGDAIEPPADDPTKTGGYTFDSWNYPATVDPDTLTMPAADVQVTAKWVGDEVTTVWIDGTDILWTNTNQEIGKEIVKPTGTTLANILTRTRENMWLDPDDLWDPQPGFAEGDAMFNLKWKSEFTVSFEANGIVIKELGHIREGQTISANDAPVARKDGKDAKWLLDGELFGFDTTPVESNLTLVASWDDTPATSADFTYNMTLTENLNMNFYVRNVKDNIDDYTVKVSIDGEDDKFFYLDNAEENIFTIAKFDARRMTDEIHVFVTDGDAVVLDNVYTIAGYCNAVIESTGNEKLKELANAILVYGANAQVTLNYKPDNLPTNDYEVSGVVIPAATAKTKGSVTGVSKFGNKVMIDNYVVLRVLLQLESGASIDNYTITVNDDEVQATKQSANVFYVDIPVSALKIGEKQIVYVEDDNGMATYALSTIVPMKRVDNDLTRALYAYYAAATEYATSM